MSNDRGEQPTWGHVNEIPRVCLDGRNLRQSIAAALIVGTVLFLINQSQIVFSGQATVATWIRIGLTYLVPFLVSNFGIAVGSRRREPR